MGGFALLASICFIAVSGGEQCEDARLVFPNEVQCRMMIPRQMEEVGSVLSSRGAMVTEYTMRCVEVLGGSEGEQG